VSLTKLKINGGFLKLLYETNKFPLKKSKKIKVLRQGKIAQ